MVAATLQQTLAHVAHVSGRGYWTGLPVTLTLLPAPPNTGILFRRVDLPSRPSLAAVADHRVDTSLRTKIKNDTMSVEMIEHVMAALYGMHIDNCIVECDSGEMPALDGSSLAIALAIEHAGAKVQAIPAPEFRIRSTIRIGNEKSGLVAIPSRESGLSILYHLDYGSESPIPSTTSAHVLSPDEFTTQIAPARTFLTEYEANELQERGVAKHVTYRDLLVFGSDGPIENSLRFVDECSRHKLLDLIGDIALCGVRLQGTIIARRSGHNLNGQMASLLRKLFEQERRHQTRAA